VVELRYGDYYEVVELAGKTVAEVRKQYEPLLSIPDRAKTKLNDRNVKKNQESETRLKDDDTLRFVEKSRKTPFFILAALVALGATAIPFAFAATTATIAAKAIEKEDFVTVSTDNCTAPAWDVFGKFKGSLGSGGQIFKIEPASGFTGDLSTIIMLGNCENLVECYRVLVMKIKIYEDDGSGENADTNLQVGTTEYLTLSKGEVDISMTGLAGKQDPFWVYLDSGFYITHPWGTTYDPSGDEDPLIYCDVTQKGAP